VGLKRKSLFFRYSSNIGVRGDEFYRGGAQGQSTRPISLFAIFRVLFYMLNMPTNTSCRAPKIFIRNLLMCVYKITIKDGDWEIKSTVWTDFYRRFYRIKKWVS